jgi:hypothetical protein
MLLKLRMEGTRARIREHAMGVILGCVLDLSILIGFTLSPIIHDIIHDNMHLFFILKMADDRRAMYDGFRKKSAHSAECDRIVKEFLNKTFADGRRVANCPCIICQNYRFLTQDKVQIHLCQEAFMPNYLVWRDHGEAEELAKSDRNEDEDRMDEVVADIGREYEIGFGEQGELLEVFAFL